MALVRDRLIVPTKDASELAYVIESTPKKYVPDVFYPSTGVSGKPLIICLNYKLLFILIVMKLFQTFLLLNFQTFLPLKNC